MACTKCGTKQMDAAEFCHKCGTRLRERAVTSQVDNVMPPVASSPSRGAQQCTFLGNSPPSPSRPQPQQVRMQSDSMPRPAPPPLFASYPGPTQSLHAQRTMSQAVPPPDLPSNARRSQPSSIQSRPQPIQPINQTAIAPTQMRPQQPSFLTQAAVSGLSPTERREIARAKVRLREKYQDSEISYASLALGFLAVLIVMMTFVVNFAHYGGIAVGIFACIVAGFSHNRSLAWLGFLLGFLAVAGGATLIVLHYMDIFTL